MSIPEVRLTGTPYEMGVQHGRELREQIRELSAIRFSLACQFADERGVKADVAICKKLAREHLPLHQQQYPEVFDEWRGISDGADMELEDVFFANALTDFQDVLVRSGNVDVHGCTSFAIGAESTASGSAVIGQTWDMHASAERFITIFHREPSDGPRSITLSTAGCLTLVGVNEHGIAIGNNNLRPNDARPGVIYLAMMHHALRQADWRDAVATITTAPRASGHNYVMAHESGSRSDIETTAGQFHEFQIDTPWYVHSNHYLAEKLQPLEDETMNRASTQHRLARLSQKLQSHDEPLTPQSLRELLADHEGGEDLAICRHGEGEAARSCAFVVVDPKERTLWAGLGPACQTQLSAYKLACLGGENVN
jgi:isopenicillin-N N-acyltransferase like protein